MKSLCCWLVRQTLLLLVVVDLFLVKVSESESDWCNGVDSYPTNFSVSRSDLGDGISIAALIVCDSASSEDQRIILTITGPDDKWFGIPFGNSMLSDAVVYTTGKSGEDEIKLYDYKNTARTSRGVQKDDQQDWDEINTITEDGKVTLIYSRLLDTGDDQDRVFSGSGRTLSVMYAISGSGLAIESQHAIQSDRYYVLDFVTGTTTSKELPNTQLKKWHGGIMWFAWNVFAYAGVIAARFKDHIAGLSGVICNKQKWFCCHISCMVTAATLTITGFVLAVVAIERGDGQHFDNPHTIVGLVILILVIFQPLNAAIRPHKQENVTSQSWARWIWEQVHRNTGRSAVILSIFNVFAGMVLLEVSETIIILQIIYICLLGASVLSFEIYVRWHDRNKSGATPVKTREDKPDKDEKKSLETEKLRNDEGEGHAVAIDDTDRAEVEL